VLGGEQSSEDYIVTSEDDALSGSLALGSSAVTETASFKESARPVRLGTFTSAADVKVAPTIKNNVAQKCEDGLCCPHK